MRRLALVAVALFACGRTPAPVIDITADSVQGLIEVELRGDSSAKLPGEILDEETQEDDEFGEPFRLERDVELRVDPEREADILSELRGRPDVLWAEPVSEVHALWLPNDPDFARQWHLKAAGAP